MTTLDVEVAKIRAAAKTVKLPSMAAILVTLIGLLPFLLAWATRAGKELIVLLIASWRHGWHSAGRQLGPKSPAGGGS